MSTNDPMTQKQLDVIRERLDCGTPTTEDVSALLAEVERLRALDTVDDAMVERAKRAFGAATAQVSSIPLGMSEAMFIDSVGLQHQHAIRAAIDAALYHTATHSKEDQ